MRLRYSTYLLAALIVAAPVAGQAAVTPKALPAAKPAILLPDGGAQTAQYDPAQGFPDRNGALSAMLVVIPQKETAVFAGQGEDRHIDRVSRAEPGANLAIKLVFVGVRPDANGVANLTYDLKVTDPEGKLYAGSDYHNLTALIGQVGDAKAVYDNRDQVILMQFEPKDTPGVYKIDAVLHDRVAKLDLPLTASVELLRTGLPTPPATPAPGADATPQTPAAQTPAAQTPAVQTPAQTLAKAAPKRVKHRRRRKHR